MKQLTPVTVESGHKRTQMPIRRSRYIHHVLLFGVAVLRVLFWLHISLNRPVQKQDAQLLETAT